MYKDVTFPAERCNPSAAYRWSQVTQRVCSTIWKIREYYPSDTLLVRCNHGFTFPHHLLSAPGMNIKSLSDSHQVYMELKSQYANKNS